MSVARQLARRLARAELRLLDDLVGGGRPHAVERVDQELPQRAGVAFLEQLMQQLERDLLDGVRAAVGQRHFDLERVAAIHGRRTRGGAVELARHDLVQPLEQQILADRDDAVGGRGADLRLLDRLVQRVGLFAADLARSTPGTRLGRVADPPRHRRTDARKRTGQKLRDRRRLGRLEHGHQPPQFHAVRMRLDLLRFGRQASGRATVGGLAAFGIDVVQRHVRIGDRRLLQVIVDAAAAALVFPFQLDRDARAAA